MPATPRAFTEAYIPDRLVAGRSQLVSELRTLLMGQNLARGSVLGRITLGAVTSAVKASGANTGNGVLTVDVATPLLPNALAGLYTVRCIAAAANAGTFRVTTPTGHVLGDLVLPGGAGGSATFSNRLKFAIADGTTDFIIGDGFDVTVAAGSGKAVLSLAAAVDGSQVPESILVDAYDATAGDLGNCGAFVQGEFDETVIVLGAGHTLASVRGALRDQGIFLKTPIPAG